ncbi:adenosylcobinamide kinase/adenosylcobinamide phosphate guanylyltransferase [Caenibius tardaugens NBRC 16725]|uniref:Bifunctional adenosylcobalamin biosynthesis protein n=1 Tax=Caenibius tardaugens NBRC 16725 TaxID=1219035 RepID=U2YLV1_9SPHN|nr:bifunctional adenosylcobinamide kinase/adenosylcobinamide-phosphate guanylyltransferase [Caenibius tardaugens]AZI37776.1 bifunctional adenosylcobinamide kinase/adenosylcobinamide-phosphate guanylyltransferase [Caenibius tardaugens NBRC 16725]GAD49660.1 adenosylcobinamide kinase/adenosylcobinamide phosphate guanylyltransferase [Caenibius tardaugens NBRC 16725]
MSSLLVLGGARSGKSHYAQHRAEALPGALVYLATAQAFDEEMRERIALHRGERGPRWSTVEAPLELAKAISAFSWPDTVVLVDCLTLWASNLLLAEQDVEAATQALIRAVAMAGGPVILVANEVGLGIVPDNALARRFRDIAGRMNQALAQAADGVVFVAAGLPLALK